MALDRKNGEFIAKFGRHDMPIPPNDFWRDSPFFAEAHNQAIDVFWKTARKNRAPMNPRIDDDDWFAQTYADKGILVFWFQKRIGRRNGVHGHLTPTTFHHPVVVTFPEETLRQLIAMGKWPSIDRLKPKFELAS
jgi:hypothetical protein